MHTIRGRLIIVFIVYLSFTGVLTCFYYYNINTLKEKLLLIEQFDDFKDNILELRRYEKNYFLTGNLVYVEQMKHYFAKTEDSFNRLEEKMIMILGKDQLDACRNAINNYRMILKEKTQGPHFKNIETAGNLRINGTSLTSFSEKLIKEKRLRVAKVLRYMSMLPLAFGVVFIILIIFVWHMTQEDVLRPLLSLQKASESARKGIFKPIEHVHREANEVSHCIAAFNEMVVEIDSGQEQLLQSRKMASIGTFTSGIAHELNNPLNNISLIVDSLIEDGKAMPEAEQQGLYNDLMEQAERATSIVKNLLEFSRTDQDHFEKISMGQMVEKTRKLLKNELSIKKVKFHARVEDNLPKAMIDKSRLQQALVNLLLNGIHAMPDGGDLYLNIASDTESDSIKIDIKDTGVGIPEEHLESIFDPFFTTKKEGEGTGLGLSVTYNIVKRHHGTISVTSEPGKGTCFSIFLPVKA